MITWARYSGPLDEDDVRLRIRELVDAGAEALVVSFTNSVVNPAHELRVREIFLEEYPGHLLGAIPMLLSHQVAGRKGEYARSSSTIMDAFLHQTMYHGLGTLELNLRTQGYDKPMLVSHNSGGMAQLNSTDALQTVHSGPVSGVAAAEHLATAAELGNVVATDMGGTSFDIGIVDQGGVKHYDFNPVIDRWLVSVPMVHLVTLGAGGGSIARFDRMYKTVEIGPQSAGSDPGPACYDRGGLKPTVTDADLLLGYFDAKNYANGRIPLNPRRAKQAMEEQLCDELDLGLIDVCKLVKKQVDASMANGIATELRTRGYEPKDFTILAYGGNGPLHACGIADALGVKQNPCPAVLFGVLGLRRRKRQPDAHPRNERLDSAVQPDDALVLFRLRQLQPRGRRARAAGPRRSPSPRHDSGPGQIPPGARHALRQPTGPDRSGFGLASPEIAARRAGVDGPVLPKLRRALRRREPVAGSGHPHQHHPSLLLCRAADSKILQAQP